jgi:hypothetical protein
VIFADEESAYAGNVLSRVLLPTRLLPDLREPPVPFRADVDTVARLGHCDVAVEVDIGSPNSIAWTTHLVHWLNNAGGRFHGIADCPVPCCLFVASDGTRQVTWCPFRTNYNEIIGVADEQLKYALHVNEYLSTRNCPLKPSNELKTIDLFAGLFLVPLLWFLDPDSNGTAWLDYLLGDIPNELYDATHRWHHLTNPVLRWPTNIATN